MRVFLPVVIQCLKYVLLQNVILDMCGNSNQEGRGLVKLLLGTGLNSWWNNGMKN